MTKITEPPFNSQQFKANPYPFYARLRAEAPAYRVNLPGKGPAWLITRYDDAARLLKDPRLAKDRRNALAAGPPAKQPWMPAFMQPLMYNMLDLDDPDHARLRGLVHKAFTPRLVGQLRGRVESLMAELLHKVRRSGRMDLVRDIALPLPVTIIADMLGVPPEERMDFHRWSNRMVSVSSSFEFLRIIPDAWAFFRYLRRLIARRRADPQDDLTSALVQAEEQGDSLNEDELLGMIFLLLVAGHETTVNLISGGVLALLQHPDQCAELRRRPELIGTAVEELLRYTSPVQLATERYARADMTIAGAEIRQGDLVLAVLASANRDETQFADPNALDLAREPNRHLAFGSGGHYCMGAPLARLEGQIAISTLLDLLPAMRLLERPDALRWRRGVFLRGVERLQLAF
jgi:cytochrome P450